jgi:hypothetical protein
MARVAVAFLALALGLCTGCFVFDEIDQGRETMKRHSGRSPRPAASAAAEPAAPEPDEGPGLWARVRDSLRQLREPAAPERDPQDEIVTCELEGGLTFTHESDCLARAGSPR